MTHPFDLPEDFPFAELGRDYATGNFKIDEIAAKYDIGRNTFLAIRRAAPKTWTKEPPNLWWDDLDEAPDEIAEQAEARQKANEASKKTKQKHQREKDKAARKWWEVEEALSEAAEAFQEEPYDPPRLQVRLSERPPQTGALVCNTQDYHVGIRPADTEGFTVSGYCDRLADAYASGLERAARNAQIDTVYLVVGGDLVHVDTYSGTTTKGTPQDLAVSPSDALTRAIELMARHVDLARQIASEVRLIGINGNHDKILSAAAFEALRQRYRNTDGVTAAGIQERVYQTYGQHLLCFTHGDYSKKKMRRFQDVINAEARGLLAETEWTTVFSGHLHHKAEDLKDVAGRLHIQASSPAPDDEWHRANAHVGARKAVQVHMLEPDAASDTTFGLAV